MKIVAIRIGDKYGPEYETYLQEKLPQHEFIWVREPYDKRVTNNGIKCGHANGYRRTDLCY